jgi:hypothetical protein
VSWIFCGDPCQGIEIAWTTLWLIIEQNFPQIDTAIDHGTHEHHRQNRSGSAYLNRFTPRDKDTAGGLN